MQRAFYFVFSSWPGIAVRRTASLPLARSRPKDGVASARLCPGHPRLPCCYAVKTWMPGTSPGMTRLAVGADCPISGGHPGFSVWQSGAGEAAIERLMGHFRSQDGAHRDQFFDIDAGIESLAFAQKHQVLEHDVAGGAGRERTAAEAAQRAVEDARAGIERCRRVRDAHASGIVQMHADRLCAGYVHDRLGQFADLLRTGIADGVGDGDEIDAGLETSFGEFYHFFRVYRPRDRTTERHRDRRIDDRLVRT